MLSAVDYDLSSDIKILVVFATILLVAMYGIGNSVVKQQGRRGLAKTALAVLVLSLVAYFWLLK